MPKPPRLPAEPPKVESLEDARQVIADLWALNRELLARLGLNSRNASRPPSRDGPGAGGAQAAGDGDGKPEAPRRARGAQPGHQGQRRALVDAVDAVVEHVPAEPCACGGAWERAAAPYRRHQVFEWPEPKVEVTGHRLYRARCTCCGAQAAAGLPAGVPDEQRGPRWLAWTGVLAGRYHRSVRQIQALLAEMSGVRFSVGALSAAQGRVSSWLTRTQQAVQAARRAGRVSWMRPRTRAPASGAGPGWCSVPMPPASACWRAARAGVRSTCSAATRAAWS